MGIEGTNNSFITPIMATNHQGNPDTRNIVAFENECPEVTRPINQRLTELAQGMTETTATNHPNCPDTNNR